MIKLTHILKESNISPGSKPYYKSNMSDDEILQLAKELSSYPYSRVKDISKQQIYFKDVANLLGLPADATDIIAYDGPRGYLDKSKVKLNPNKARIYKMYKDKKLDMKEYGEIQGGLMKKYIQLGKTIINWISTRK